MDWGQLIPAAAIAVGTIGTGRHLWRTRTPARPVVVAARSHVRPVKSCVESGSTARSATDASSVVATPHTPSLALDAYSTIAGGTELEARMETARRRLAQHAVFGDAAVRRRERDPLIVSAVESYLAHPSQQEATP